MQPPVYRVFIFLLFISLVSRADEIFFNLNQEFQSFYLNPQNSSPFFARTELKTKGSLDITRELKFKLDTTSSSTFMKKQVQKSFLFNPTQLGIVYSSQSFDLFAGGFTLAGDGADLNNIFDIVNAQDYRQPFNTKEIGSVGLLATKTFDCCTLKLFYIPKNTKSLLPDTQSAWWPRTDALPITNSDGTFLSPDNMSYKILSESENEKPFEQNFGAQFKTSLSNLDLTLFYFKGANQTPKISPHVNITAISLDPLIGVIQPPVELNLTWFQSEHFGAGGALVLDDWITKVYCKQQKDFLSNSIEKSSACTASVENSFNISKFSLRYFLQLNRVWKETTSLQELETLLGFYEKSTALGFYLDMDTKGTVSGAVIYNEKDPSFLVSSGYEYRFSDQFKTKLSANILTSSGQNPLAKAYDKTDNLSLSFDYDF